MAKQINWRDKAVDEAGMAADHFIDEIIEDILSQEGPTNKKNIADYDQDYSFQLGDTGYSLRQAADLLEELHEFEADDDSLWEGQQPRDAIDIMAGQTFRNAVESLFDDLIGEINGDVEQWTDTRIFWDEDDWMQSKEAPKGVLDWEPDVKVEEKEAEAVSKLHKIYLKKEVTALVKAAVKEWKGR